MPSGALTHAADQHDRIGTALDPTHAHAALMAYRRPVMPRTGVVPDNAGIHSGHASAAYPLARVSYW
jgi:hypothetical protein